jgi:excisionase family DNA binding protein
MWSALDCCHPFGYGGLLCNSCNTALGLFKDSEELQENALRYRRQKRGREVELLPVDAVRVMPNIIQMNGETHYSTEEACDYLGISRDTSNRMTKDGLISFVRLSRSEAIFEEPFELGKVLIV